LRKYPENIIYGNNIKCTKKLASDIISQSSKIGEVIIEFKEPDTSSSIFSVSADTTLYELVVLTHPELANFVDYLFLVRSFKNHDLFLNPDAMPIAPYFYPDATWSIELKFVPPTLTVPMLPLLRHYLFQQISIHKDDEYLKLCSNLIPCDIDVKETDMKTLYGKLGESQLLSSRHYLAYLDNGQQIDIGVSPNCVSIRNASSKNYFVMDLRSLSFDCINSQFLLTFGNRALTLNKEMAFDLLPLFAFAVEKWTENETKIDNFSAIISNSHCSVQGIKKEAKSLNVKDENVDDVLLNLKNFKDKKLKFSQNINN
jgi:hypothetical protein